MNSGVHEIGTARRVRAFHIMPGVSGPEGELHAHDYRVEVIVERRELDEIYRRHPMTQDVWISFNQFAAGNISIMIIHWWKGTDHQKYLAGMQEMNLAVKERFDAEGIAFA